MKVSSQLQAFSFNLQEKGALYIFGRRLGGPQYGSGSCDEEKISCAVRPIIGTQGNKSIE
jgi:hypothetical protein